MIEWSIDAFRGCEAVRAIVVAAPPGHAGDLGGVAPAGDGGERGDVAAPGVEIVDGGATRASSVANALAVVETALVAIHDAARPLLTPELVEALVARLDQAPGAAGVIAATPVTDTIKRVAGVHKEPPAVEETLDRAELWAAQTPQVFRTEVLREALAAAADPERATDEAMLVEGAGGTVLIHPCGPQNIKVTTPLDLRVAELLLGARSAAQQ